MKNDLSGRKVGDWIWTIQEGWVTLDFIDNNEVFTGVYAYALNGNYYPSDKYPSAFLEPPEGFNAEPRPCEFKKGDKVLVSDYAPDYGNRRYFSHVCEDGLYHCYAGGMSDWTSEDGYTNPWRYCKKWED